MLEFQRVFDVDTVVLPFVCSTRRAQGYGGIAIVYYFADMYFLLNSCSNKAEPRFSRSDVVM